MKQSKIENHKINASILNRILMKANPDFFNLPEEEQLIYRVNFFGTVENDNIFNSIIGKEVFDLDLTSDAFNAMPNMESSIYNTYRTLLCGYGNSNIDINEMFTVNNPIYQFKTIFDYDKSFELNQFRLEIKEAERNKNQKRADEFKDKKYEFRLRPLWIRAVENNTLHYITAMSFAEHAHIMMSSHMHNEARKHYPKTSRVATPNDSDDESISFQFGIVGDYNGKKAYWKELTSRGYAYINELHKEIVEKMKNMDTFNGVVSVRSQEKDENNILIIISDGEVAKKITWENFLSDVESLKVSDSSIDDILKPYMAKIDNFLIQEYKDIEANFDPSKVVPFKEVTIVYSDEAKDDLARIIQSDIDEKLKMESNKNDDQR